MTPTLSTFFMFLKMFRLFYFFMFLKLKQCSFQVMYITICSREIPLKLLREGFFVEYLQARMDYATRLYHTAEYEEAKIVFTSLLKTYKKHQATKEICLCLYNLACIAYVRGEIQTFHKLFTQFEQLSTSVNDQQLQVEYYVLRGLTQLGCQQYEQALTTFTHVLFLSEQEIFIKQKVSALLYIQTCQILMARYEASLKISDDIWSLYEHIITPDTGQLYHYLLNRADTMLALNRLEEADALLTRCEEHSDYMIVPIEHIKTLVSRAKYHLAQQQPTIAITILEHAHQYAAKQEDVNLLSEIYETLIKNYELLDQTKAALACAKKRLKLHKELIQQ